MLYREIQQILKVNGLINLKKFEEYKTKSNEEIKKLINEKKFDEATFLLVIKIGEKITDKDLFETMNRFGFKEYTEKEQKGNLKNFFVDYVFTYNQNFKILISGIRNKKELESINVYKLS